MKKLVICFSDELRAASDLVARADKLPGETVLWVPGGLGAYPPSDTGAGRIVEIKAANEAVLAEPFACAQALFALFNAELPELILMPSSPRGDALAAQLSLLLGGACVTAAAALFSEDGAFIVRRSVFAGNIEADFAVRAPLLCLSLLPGGESAAKSEAPEISTLYADAALPDWLTDFETVKEEKAGSLTEAKLVVAAGRGAGNKAKLEKLAALAETLGGTLGGSRPLVCEGKLPPERQLGLSGARVTPELCLVFGASGAAAFRAGIDGSKKIVAVNRDPDAPIFESCDVGVVADCGEFAAALSDALAQR